MNNKLISLLALAENNARTTSETYAEIAGELSALMNAVRNDPAPAAEPSDTAHFPVKGRLRDQIRYVLDQAGTEGLTTGAIVQRLNDQAYKYGGEIALAKLAQTLVNMERQGTEIRVERLPNGRKMHYLIRECPDK